MSKYLIKGPKKYLNIKKKLSLLEQICEFIPKIESSQTINSNIFKLKCDKYLNIFGPKVTKHGNMHLKMIF